MKAGIRGFREVSLAAESLAAVDAGLRAITGHDGYETQVESTPPIEATFRSYAVGTRSIAVMESLGEKTAISRFLTRRGAGPFSVTFQVDDVEEAVAHVRSRGGGVLLERPITLREVRSGSERFEQIRLNFIAPAGPAHGLVVEFQELAGGEDARAPEIMVAPDVPTAINEVHFAVHDLDAAAADLANLYGLEVGPLVEQPDPPEQVRFRNLYCDDMPILALISPSAPDSTVQRFLERRGPGIFTISMRVSDLDMCMRRVTAAGIQLLFPGAKVAKDTRIGSHAIDRARIAWVRPQLASNRVLFELQEYGA